MKNRLKKIKDILLKNRKISVSELSELLKVSEVTIRKDLDFLESQGLVVRRYGGAVLAENPSKVVSFLKKENINAERKRRIAHYASKLISTGENIILDAGSTALELARKLKISDNKLGVITNSLPVAYELRKCKDIRLEMTGGSLRKASAALVGPAVINYLDSVYVDKVFLGCSGFDLKRGFSSENMIEAEVKRKMLNCAEKKIMLADASKFKRPAFANFAEISSIDLIITSGSMPDEILKKINKTGIKVINT